MIDKIFYITDSELKDWVIFDNTFQINSKISEHVLNIAAFNLLNLNIRVSFCNVYNYLNGN